MIGLESVHLTFRLDPHATRVASRIAFRPNPETSDREFLLHGENLKLIRAAIDGKVVAPGITKRGLTCPVPDGPFVWEAEVEIDPAGNTALEGLYVSNGMYCTQCEAEDQVTASAIQYQRFENDRKSINSKIKRVGSNACPREVDALYGVWRDAIRRLRRFPPL